MQRNEVPLLKSPFKEVSYALHFAFSCHYICDVLFYVFYRTQRDFSPNIVHLPPSLLRKELPIASEGAQPHKTTNSPTRLRMQRDERFLRIPTTTPPPHSDHRSYLRSYRELENGSSRCRGTLRTQVLAHMSSCQAALENLPPERRQPSREVQARPRLNRVDCKLETHRVV